MVLGTGIDIIEVERIKKIAERNPRFLEKIFTSREIDYCMKKTNKYQHLAARFAAKEAFFKAICPQGQRGIGYRDIEVVMDKSGGPRLRSHGKAHKALRSREAALSIAHERDFAVAVVITSMGG